MTDKKGKTLKELGARVGDIVGKFDGTLGETYFCYRIRRVDGAGGYFEGTISYDLPLGDEGLWTLYREVSQ